MINNFCSNCGAELCAGAKFCRNCGTKVDATASVETSAKQTSPVILSVPASFKKGLLSIKGCTLVFTDSDMLVAITDKTLMNAHITNVRDQARGTGFMKKTAAVMKAGYTFSERYYSMSADAIMAENRDNFSIPFNTIKSIRYKKGTVRYDADNTSSSSPPSMTMKTTTGKYVFTFSRGYMSKELITYLNNTFPGRYKGPRR